MDDDLPEDLDQYAADYFGLKKGDIRMINDACDKFFDSRGMPRGRGLFETTNQKSNRHLRTVLEGLNPTAKDTN